MKRILALATLSLACGAQSVTLDSPQQLPNGSRNENVSGDPRSCDHLGPLISSPRDEPIDRPSAPNVAMAGQMTEQAARAKRLFDAERWAEAETALAAVAHGQTGDDVGNMQLAQYHLAIAIFRQKDFRRSYRIFSEMARDRSHIKHPETLLWLVKYVTDHAELVDFADFASYTREEVARFDNSSQRDLYSSASFAVGRERLQEGARAEATAFFAHVDPDGPFGVLVARCRERAR
jgi:hypothetical protein